MHSNLKTKKWLQVLLPYWLASWNIFRFFYVEYVETQLFLLETTRLYTVQKAKDKVIKSVWMNQSWRFLMAICLGVPLFLVMIYFTEVIEIEFSFYFMLQMSVSVLLASPLTQVLPDSVFTYKNKRWRFWVLKHVHYLQDFVEIRKIAEQKDYISINEKWLSKKYIRKRTSKTQRLKLYEKLEVFEYAYQRDFEENLPDVIQYQYSSKKWRLEMMGFILIPVLIYLEYKGLEEWIYFAYFIVIINIPFLLINLPWKALWKIGKVSSKTVILEANPKGIETIIRKKKTTILWEYISRLELEEKEEKAEKGVVTIPYINVYIDYKDYPKKIIPIKINNLNTQPKLIFKQINTLCNRYLEQNQLLEAKYN